MMVLKIMEKYELRQKMKSCGMTIFGGFSSISKITMPEENIS
jgi:hypothetical protein